jgi:hypothetical protein
MFPIYLTPASTLRAVTPSDAVDLVDGLTRGLYAGRRRQHLRR